eukprot:jgi/Botrbrau1/6339/Bobra.0339s0045.1
MRYFALKRPRFMLPAQIDLDKKKAKETKIKKVSSFSSSSDREDESSISSFQRNLIIRNLG